MKSARRTAHTAAVRPRARAPSTFTRLCCKTCSAAPTRASLTNGRHRYRDPNPLVSLEAFDRSAEWAAQGSFALRDIDEAKLSLFQGIDAPVSPGSRGLGEFSTGITDEMRQAKCGLSGGGKSLVRGCLFGG